MRKPYRIRTKESPERDRWELCSGTAEHLPAYEYDLDTLVLLIFPLSSLRIAIYPTSAFNFHSWDFTRERAASRYLTERQTKRADTFGPEGSL